MGHKNKFYLPGKRSFLHFKDDGSNFSSRIINGPINSLNPYKNNSSYNCSYNVSGKLPGKCTRTFSNIPYFKK